MANFIKTAYGTKINVQGLTPEQIKRVRSVAEDKGAYGAKGAALAKTLRQRVSTQPVPGGGDPVTGGGDPQLGANGKQDPGTEGLGETATTVDNFLEGIFQNLKPLDLSGAPKIMTGNDLQSSRQGVYDSIYRQNTQNLQRDKNLALQEQKQELANRGIPIGFGDQDPYGQAVGAVNQRFDTLNQNAMDSANLGADQSLQTLSNVNKTAQDAFLENATQQYNSQLNAATVGGDILQTLMQKFGISREEAQQKLNRKSAEKIARIQSARSGGGGGGEVDSGDIISGPAAGWGI